MPDDAFADLARVTIDALLGDRDEGSWRELASLQAVSSSHVRSVQASLRKAIAERTSPTATRGNPGFDAPAAPLSAQQLDVLESLLGETGERLGRVLCVSEQLLPAIHDVQWHVLAPVGPSAPADECRYVVRLLTSDARGEVGSVEFACSRAHLQDMVRGHIRAAFAPRCHPQIRPLVAQSLTPCTRTVTRMRA